MLRIKSVHKTFGTKEVLKDVTCEIKRGEIVGLVGENGAGKSTLLEIIATLQRPTKGTIELAENSYDKSLKQVRKQIGFVPQDIAVWEEFTVKENMMFFEKFSWKRRSVEELRSLCLDMNLDRWDDKVNTLSGGMKRKLNVAISLIHEPNILLLDEPTVGIDLKSKQEISRHLVQLAKDKHLTIIYTSHDMDEIMNVCDYTYCLGDDPFYETFLKERGQRVEVL
ncbi:MAG TPA: ABC transporter ATP-binding protein [Bacillota bacterium]|nr:ABC transporter ATP-binding protein [Bacillota bacterium]